MSYDRYIFLVSILFLFTFCDSAAYINRTAQSKQKQRRVGSTVYNFWSSHVNNLWITEIIQA